MRSTLRCVCFFLFSFCVGATDGSFSKYSYERLDISCDFIQRAPAGVAIDSITAVDVRTNADMTGTLIASSPVPAVSMSKVIFRVLSGTPGDQYHIIIRVIRTDTGAKLEAIIVMLTIQE